MKTCGDGTVVDHTDRNPLNNQSTNLRRISHTQNMQNRRKNANNTTGYTGVVRGKSGRWSAVLSVNGKNRYFGVYDNILDAARARDKAAKLHRGEFAVLNFPDE